MKIGDEIYVHGFVDEIRKDVVIIKNEGGYFGTVPSEIIDKYAEQEPTSPCDLCRFDYMDGVCGDCPAMAKGGE